MLHVGNFLKGPSSASQFRRIPLALAKYPLCFRRGISENSFLFRSFSTTSVESRKARVVFDTGSTNLWVASVLCKAELKRAAPLNGSGSAICNEAFSPPLRGKMAEPVSKVTRHGPPDRALIC